MELGLYQGLESFKYRLGMLDEVFSELFSKMLVSVPSLGALRAFPVFEVTVSSSEGSFDLWGDDPCLDWFPLMVVDGMCLLAR